MKLPPPPKMSPDERAKFEKIVTELFNAGKDSGWVADYMLKPVSGFGRYWENRDHALTEINSIYDRLHKTSVDLPDGLYRLRRRSTGEGYGEFIVERSQL